MVKESCLITPGNAGKRPYFTTSDRGRLTYIDTARNSLIR